MKWSMIYLQIIMKLTMAVNQQPGAFSSVYNGIMNFCHRPCSPCPWLPVGGRAVAKSEGGGDESKF